MCNSWDLGVDKVRHLMGSLSGTATMLYGRVPNSFWTTSLSVLKLNITIYTHLKLHGLQEQYLKLSKEI